MVYALALRPGVMGCDIAVDATEYLDRSAPPASWRARIFFKFTLYLPAARVCDTIDDGGCKGKQPMKMLIC